MTDLALKVFIACRPEDEPAAMYAFRELSLRWGMPIARTERLEEAEIAYAPPDMEARTAARKVFISYDPGAYLAPTPFMGVQTEGLHTWRPSSDSGRPWDAIGATFRLLAMLDEQGIPEEKRTQNGSFHASDLPAERFKLRRYPLVDAHAEVIFRRWALLFPEKASHAAPRWPHGKQWALILTHDADAIHLGAIQEIAANLAKGVIRLDASHLSLAFTGVRNRGLTNNPLWCFPRWTAFEKEIGLRSCFYLYIRPSGVPRDLHDCRSGVRTEPIDWDYFRGLIQEGWEIGAHPSIHSWRQRRSMESCRQILEHELKSPVPGVRCHYLSHDWRNPFASLKRMAAESYAYDSSIGWFDDIGYRAATSLPFHIIAQPGDTQYDDFYEIPVSVMDGYLSAPVCSSLSEENLEATLNLMEARTIASLHGALVLDWHQETLATGTRGEPHLRHLLRLLDWAAERGDCWFARPLDVINYWKQRAKDIHEASRL